MNVVKQGKWLSMCEENGYEYFHRHKKPDAVCIIGLTTLNELILVEQKRVPHSKLVVELPAGLVDEGETVEQTAFRELIEETGYGNGKIEQIIPNVLSTPGICTEGVTILFITGLEKIAKGGGLESENEHINVLTIHPLKEFNLIKRLTDSNRLFDAKLLYGLEFCKSYLLELEVSKRFIAMGDEDIPAAPVNKDYVDFINARYKQIELDLQDPRRFDPIDSD